MVGLRAAILLMALAGCSANHAPENDQTNARSGGGEAAVKLASSVEVEVGTSTVRLVLRVTNSSNEPVVLEFTSGQRYDFAVRTSAGAEVWRWSSDQMFTQALGSERLAPGATLEYSQTWPHGGRQGSFVALAELKATNHSIAERAEFVLR